MSLGVGHKSLGKRRTYSWIRKAGFVVAPFLLKSPKYGVVTTVVGLVGGAAVGIAMSHISPDPRWNMTSGFAIGAILTGKAILPAMFAGQVVGLVESLSRFQARRMPGGLDRLIEQRDMRRITKAQEKANQKLRKDVMKAHKQKGP